MSAVKETDFLFHDHRLSVTTRSLTGPDGKPIQLRPREFEALVVLLRAAGSVVSKQELLHLVWPDTIVEDNNLNQVISGLRQALGDNRKTPQFIATITGRGYQLVCPVQAFDSDQAQSAQTTKVTSGNAARRPSNRLLVLISIAALAVFWWGWQQRDGATPVLKLQGAQLVSPSPSSNASPTLSPDGTMMAFVSNRSGVEHIWVRSTGSGEPVQLTQGKQSASSPSWAPHSNRIIYQAPNAQGLSSIWLMDALGSRQPQLVVSNAFSPRFAPDGKRFVFTREDNQIYVASIADGNVQKLEGAPATTGFAAPSPAINEQGDIVFVLADEGPSGNLWLYRAADETFTRLTESEGALSGVWAKDPIWLPDNQTVIYAASTADPFNTHLWSVDVRSGRTVQISSGVGGYSQPSVSRDGEVFAYTHARPFWRLMRKYPDTGKDEVLLETRGAVALPVISPDGKQVAYFGDGLFTLPVEGGQPRAWTDEARLASTLPVWSRSEPVLWFYRDRALHRLDTRTGAVEQMLDDFHWSQKNWLAVHGDQLAYRIRSRIPGRARSVIHDLGSGQVRRVKQDILPTDFSRDGRWLLARALQDSLIVICDVRQLDCQPLVHNGEPVAGAMPRWSADEQQVFFRRARWDKPGYAYLWRADRDGQNLEQVVEVGPYQSVNFFFAVAHDNSLIWPQFDNTSSSEIWQVQGPAAQSAP